MKRGVWNQSLFLSSHNLGNNLLSYTKWVKIFSHSLWEWEMLANSIDLSTMTLDSYWPNCEQIWASQAMGDCLLITCFSKSSSWVQHRCQINYSKQKRGIFSMNIWTSCTLLYIFTIHYRKNCRINSTLHFEILHGYELGKFPAKLLLVHTNRTIQSSETSFIF